MTGPREAADWECNDTTNSVTRRDKSPGEPLQLCCGTPVALGISPTCDLVTPPIWSTCDEYDFITTARNRL